MDQSQVQFDADVRLYTSILEAASINVDDDEYTECETMRCPMHPGLYWRLKNVHGFCAANGRTYAEYVARHAERADAQPERGRDKGIAASNGDLAANDYAAPDGSAPVGRATDQQQPQR